jgi:hypothetical protein
MNAWFWFQGQDMGVVWLVIVPVVLILVMVVTGIFSDLHHR